MLDDAHLAEILADLHAGTGMDFRGYRRSTLQRRVRVRMSQLGIPDPETYLERLRNDSSEHQHLISVIGVNVSAFFRDAEVFACLAEKVLPSLLADRREQTASVLRVWSAGCASGEEAYSVAALVRQALGRQSIVGDPLIFATDISERSLEAARRGVYPAERLREVPFSLLEEYFQVTGDQVEVRAELKKMVIWGRDDLTSLRTVAPPGSVFGHFDLVLCRNLLIYFEASLHARVLRKLREAVAPGGYLVLGSAEWLDPETEPSFTLVNRPCRIWRKPA